MALTKIDKSDARYPSLTRGNNPRWQGTPKYVYLPTSADEASEAFDEVKGGKFAARGGGHCYINSVDRPGEDYSIIDMGLINQVRHDDVNGAISIDSGARLGEVYKYLFRRWGVTLPGGSCGTVGVGGHVAGGGYGLLSRLYGVTVDWLYGVEVITKDGGKPVLATRDNKHKDLWWAHTGGGGGNFGLVTRFLFRNPGVSAEEGKADPKKCLPEAPSRVQLMTLKMPWTEDHTWLDNLTEKYTKWCEDHAWNHKEDADRLFGLFRVKTPGTTPENHALHLTVQVAELGEDGGPEKAEAVLKEFRESVQIDEATKTHGGPGVVDFTEDLPWLEATQNLSGGDWEDRAKQKSAYHVQFTKYHRETMIYHWKNPLLKGFGNGQKPGRGALAQLDTYGAAVNRGLWVATAYSHRMASVKIQYQAYWSSPNKEEDSPHLSWLNTAYGEIYRHDANGEPSPAFDEYVGSPKTDGCFVNYLDDDLQDYGKLYWGTHTLKRLQEIKGKTDPNGVFASAQPIPKPWPEPEN